MSIPTKRTTQETAIAVVITAGLAAAVDLHSPEGLAEIAGVILSLAFSYIPGLRAAFESLSADYKRLIMLGLLFLASAGIFALGCWGIIEGGYACDLEGAKSLAGIFIAAAIANQTAYLLTPAPKEKLF